jgi:nucleotide-binding universal stress UspA family protein
MKILCATDFSDAGLAAEAQALDLARALDAEFVYVHVTVEPVLYGVLDTSDLKQVFEAQRRWAEDALAQRLNGTHGRTGLDRVLLGSVAERVLRLAPCPVLTVRPRASAPPAAA